MRALSSLRAATLRASLILRPKTNPRSIPTVTEPPSRPNTEQDELVIDRFKPGDFVTVGTNERRAAWFLLRAVSKSDASGVTRPKPFWRFFFAIRRLNTTGRQ